MTDFKRGDKVTSLLLVGEWTVLNESDDNLGYWWVERDDAGVAVWHENLTRVRTLVHDDYATSNVPGNWGDLP